MTTPIAVLIVDDEPFVRDGLAGYVAMAGDMTLAGTCADGHQAIAAVRTNPPDVILMDLRMPHLDGFRATQLIAEVAPATKVIALTTFPDGDDALRFLKCGGWGFLIKSARSDFVLNAIRSAHAGIAVFSPKTAHQLSSQAMRATRPLLSEREEQVLAALVQGLPTSAIGRELYTSESTVKADVVNLKRKFGVANRADLITKAKRLGPPE